MPNALTVFQPQNLADAQEMAQIFNDSGFVPAKLIKQAVHPVPAIVVCFEIAALLGVHPLAVMNEVYFVHGVPSFSTKFKVALLKRSGAIKGRMKFDDETDERGTVVAVTARCVDAEDDEVYTYRVSMKQASVAGWTSNKKYQEIPGVMLGYRAASFLMRRHFPDVILSWGMGADTEEIVDEAPPQAFTPLADTARPSTGHKALGLEPEMAFDDASNAIETDAEAVKDIVNRDDTPVPKAAEVVDEVLTPDPAVQTGAAEDDLF